jgi:hypothetical protein
MQAKGWGLALSSRVLGHQVKALGFNPQFCKKKKKKGKKEFFLLKINIH